MQRIRESSNPSNVLLKQVSQTLGPYQASLPNKPNTAVNGLPGGDYGATYEKIIDIQKGYKNYYNPCTHYKEEMFRERQTHSYTVMYRPSVGAQYQLACLYTGNLPATSESAGSEISPSDEVSVPMYSNLSQMEAWQVPDFSAEAMLAMLPGIKQEMSLVNSIIELKDFKTLPKLWNRIQYFLSKHGLFGLVSRAQGRRTLKQLTGLGADSYLSYEFAIRPLVSDIVALARSLKGYRRQVDEILAREGRPQCRHWSKPVSPASFGITKPETVIPRTYVGMSYHQSWSACFKHSVFTGDNAKYTATVVYSYQLSDYERKHAYALGLADALGVSATFSIIWNALPWSFVIDWFLKVGNWLKQFDPRALQPRVRLHRFIHAVKLTTETQVLSSPWAFYNPMLNSSAVNHSISGPLWVIAKSKRRHYYVRRVTTPSMFTGLQTSDFSTKEISLATALIVPRSWRR